MRDAAAVDRFREPVRERLVDHGLARQLDEHGVDGCFAQNARRRADDPAVDRTQQSVATGGGHEIRCCSSSPCASIMRITVSSIALLLAAKTRDRQVREAETVLHQRRFDLPYPNLVESLHARARVRGLLEHGLIAAALAAGLIRFPRAASAFPSCPCRGRPPRGRSCTSSTACCGSPRRFARRSRARRSAPRPRCRAAFPRSRNMANTGPPKRP